MTGKWGAKTMTEFENILKQNLAPEEMSLQQNLDVACCMGMINYCIFKRKI